MTGEKFEAMDGNGNDKVDILWYGCHNIDHPLAKHMNTGMVIAIFKTCD